MSECPYVIMDQNNRNELITFYFNLGLQYREILSFLMIRHNICLSERQLKRILKQLNLRRRINYSCIEDVCAFIENQVLYSSRLHGYRWMHLKCLQNGFVVTQNTVRHLLKAVDPEGVSFRKRKRLRRRQYHNKGPNYLWHIDSYDKLKPYGIEINGCIDGFSRYIIWLRAAYSNSNPRIISSYFLKAVETCNGCPRTVRADLGTENKYVELMQNYLRENFESENWLPAFIYGTSQHNQRIEAWWSILRKHNSQYWMNLFEHLKDSNYFNGTFIDKSLIQYCFLDVIQAELDQICLQWNCHRITSSKNSRAPVGKPVVMYNMPEAYGAIDYILMTISNEEIETFREACIFPENHPLCRSREVYELCKIFQQENHYDKPQNAHECVEFYIKLRDEMYSLLNS